jgi:hypothetical protein
MLTLLFNHVSLAALVTNCDKRIEMKKSNGKEVVPDSFREKCVIVCKDDERTVGGACYAMPRGL